jgi:hypothetical protein
VAFALLPAGAWAAPEDPPVGSVLPANGAVLPVNADGIEVRYTCPEPYRSAGESPFITYGNRTIRAGTFQLALLCPQAGINPFTTQIADAPLPGRRSRRTARSCSRAS